MDSYYSELKLISSLPDTEKYDLPKHRLLVSLIAIYSNYKNIKLNNTEVKSNKNILCSQSLGIPSLGNKLISSKKKKEATIFSKSFSFFSKKEICKD
jgi:hypothetical protein